MAKMNWKTEIGDICDRKNIIGTNLEQDVDDEDVENVFERDNHAVEHSFELGHSIDCLQGSEHSQQFQ